MSEANNIPNTNQLQQSELMMLYEIGIAMRSTLRLDEILYIILTSVTAQEGLRFNRAMVFLVNEKDKILEGRMGIGPDSGEDAHQIWNYIEKEQKTLEDLVSAHKEFVHRTNSHLNNLVKSVKLPIQETSGVLAQTVLKRTPIEIIDEKSLEQLLPEDPVIALFKTEYFVTVPLLAKDRVVGVMLIDNFFSKQLITRNDLWKLTMFANQAGMAIENSQEFEKTLILSNTDRLTGLWNYGFFQYQLNEELKRANRFNRYLSLLMIDIDFFKVINDTFGHPSADKILQQFTTILKNSCREVDLIARYGGEEFAIILPETYKEKAYSSAERIRKITETTSFQFEGHHPPKKITVSIGVANFPQDASDFETIVACADKALYAAKKTGRNRVCMYSKELTSD